MNCFGHIKFAAKSDIGRKRKNNEDNFGSFPQVGLFCVADGMGGGDDGEIASASVVREVESFATNHPFPEDGAYPAIEMASGVARALCKASEWIFERARERRLSGCGSTVVGFVLDAVVPGKAIAFHAGDSRLYRLRGRSIKQLTKDHSAAELIGEKDENKVNPMFRGMVLRAVGVRPKVEVEFTNFDVKPKDRLLLCSDGLSKMIADGKILSISRSEQDVEKAVSSMIAAANDAGGVDNVTAVLIEIGTLPEPTPQVDFPDEPEETSVSTVGSTAESETGVTGGTTGMTVMQDEIGDVENASAPDITTLPSSHTSRRIRGIIVAAAAFIAVLIFGLILKSCSSKPSPEKPVVVSAEPAIPEPVVVTNSSMTVDIVEDVKTNELETVIQPEEPVTEGESEQQIEPIQPVPQPTVSPQPEIKSDGWAELAAVCSKEKISQFEEIIRYNLPANSRPAFMQEMKKAKMRAQSLVRMKNEKSSEGFLVDLKYALQAADEFRSKMEDSSRLASAWDIVADVDGSQTDDVCRAAAELIEKLLSDGVANKNMELKR